MIMRLVASALLTALSFGTPLAAATVIGHTAEPSHEATYLAGASTQTGFTAIALDDLFDTMRVLVRISPLPDNTPAVEIKCCDVVSERQNASVAATVPILLEFPLGVTYKSYDRIMTLALDSEANALVEPGNHHGAH